MRGVAELGQGLIDNQWHNVYRKILNLLFAKLGFVVAGFGPSLQHLVTIKNFINGQIGHRKNALSTLYNGIEI